eukprot:Sspe_Gene.54151::Locus_29896_Transcript_1_1_Confidence_1.000_Length_1263::g.54151::m.54151
MVCSVRQCRDVEARPAVVCIGAPPCHPCFLLDGSAALLTTCALKPLVCRPFVPCGEAFICTTRPLCDVPGERPPIRCYPAAICRSSRPLTYPDSEQCFSCPPASASPHRASARRSRSTGH